MKTVVLKFYVASAIGGIMKECEDTRTNEQVIFDAIEQAFGESSAYARCRHSIHSKSDTGHEGDWLCYFTLLSNAKITMLVAKHFAPCTQPEADCLEIIDQITRALKGGQQ